MEARVPQVRQDEDKERRGGGLWVSFLRKLGLGPAYPPCAGPVSLGVDSAAPATLGLLETLIGTDAGLVAVLVAGTTAAIAGGVIGHQAFSTGPQPVEASAGPWALFPTKARRPAQAALPAASADGSSSSLEYMAQAAKRDAWLRERIGDAAASTPAGSPASSFAASAGRADAGKMAALPDHTSAPAARGTLAKTPGFGGGSGGMSSGSASAGLRDAPNARLPGPGAKVYGLTAPPRNRTSAMDGRRALVGNRGARTSDALRFANRDGLSQRGARNPTMTAAGYTFDGAGVNGIQGSQAGAPTADTFGGIQGPKDRFAPDKAIDQKEIPQPVPPAKEEDKTPYKGLMYAAIGALLGAMLLQKFAGQKKEAAMKLPSPAREAALGTAAMLHWMAAALAALAAALGAMIMKQYDQKMQGMVFIGSGGMLALYNIKAALDVRKGAADAKAAEDKAMDGIEKTDDQINQQLTTTGE